MRRLKVRQVRARKLEQLALIGVRALLENDKGVRRFAPAFMREPTADFNCRSISQNFSSTGVASPFEARENIESNSGDRSQPPSHKATASQGGQRGRTGVCQPRGCLSLLLRGGMSAP